MEAAAPTEVKLWDWQTGLPGASLGVRARGVSRLAFSRDGELLCGLIDPVTRVDTSPTIVVWDVAARRRGARAGRAGRGRRGASVVARRQNCRLQRGESDTTVGHRNRPRDCAILGDATWSRCLAFAPDGRRLAIGSNQTIKWCAVGGDRSQTDIEVSTEPLTVCSIACSADGGSLAVAGCIRGPDGKWEEGQVWLYEVGPRGVLRRRAVLTFDQLEGTIQNELPPVCSDVVFTPDGTRVIAVGGSHVRTWNASSARLENAFMQFLSSSSDRLAVSSNGLWLVIIGSTGFDCVDIPPAR